MDIDVEKFVSVRIMKFVINILVVKWLVSFISKFKNFKKKKKIFNKCLNVF